MLMRGEEDEENIGIGNPVIYHIICNIYHNGISDCPVNEL